MKAAPWPITEPLPSELSDGDLMRVLNISMDTFYKRKKRGDFDGWRVHTQFMSRHTRYSGELVDRHRKGGERPLSVIRRKAS